MKKSNPLYTSLRVFGSTLAILAMGLCLPSWSQGNSQSSQPNSQPNRTTNAIPANSIVPDDSSAIRSNLDISGNTVNITGGSRRGNNLFHSFSEFNVLRGQQVYFVPGSNIDDVIARVTGSNSSNIFGRLGVSGGANLWLLNPNGVIFGNEASLDISGAFFATTSDIPLGDRTFSATTPLSNGTLLSVPPDTAFQNYLISPNAGDISSTARLISDGGITLVGDVVNLGFVRSLSGPITVIANGVDTDFLRSQGAPITLRAQAGDIEINKILSSATQGGGNILLQASDNILVRNRLFSDGIADSNITSLPNDTIGNGGNITLISDQGDITIGTAELGNNGLSARSFSSGNSASRRSISAETITETSAEISTETNTATIRDTSDGGNVLLLARSGSIENLGTINTRAYATNGSAANGGNITITAENGDILNENYIISTAFSFESGNAGNGGDIQITAPQGEVTNNAYLESGSFVRAEEGEFTAGESGNITLFALNDIEQNNFLTTESFSGSGDSGSGGNISITSARGDVRLSGNNTPEAAAGPFAILLSASSFSRSGISGNGGDITIQANSGNILAEDLDVSTYSISEAGATDTNSSNSNGGAVTLSAQSTISGFNIFTLSSSKLSGAVNIESTGDLLLQDTRLVTTAQEEIEALRTYLLIDADEIIEIRSSLENTGSSGEVEINSDGNLILDNVEILSDTFAEDQAPGDISLFSPGIVALRNGSALLANARNSDGDGGNIIINADLVAAIPNENNDITAQLSVVPAVTSSSPPMAF
ncbi:MAG: filamentous hemagglutinin N-terminal domain-containing protein [Cyanobacteria bacterium J06649_4]